MTGDILTTLTIVLVAIAIWVALFLLFRQIVLWYFRINERTELLREIRDSLRQAQAARPAWVPSARDPQPATSGEVRRRTGESDDQYNSRVADALQRELRGR